MLGIYDVIDADVDHYVGAVKKVQGLIWAVPLMSPDMNERVCEKY